MMGELIDGRLSGTNRYRELELGNILFFPGTPILPAGDREFLLDVRQSGGKLHKNVSYKPAHDKVSGFDGGQGGFADRLRAVMRGYSDAIARFLDEMLPGYSAGRRKDYASFRPYEEKGRDLSWKKRNDLLHVDAFPTRPTGGDLILRVFTNINPAVPRVWTVSDPFEPLARRHAKAAGLERISAKSRSAGTKLRFRLTNALRSLKVPVVARSPYDRFMLSFHDYLKQNDSYQRDTPKYNFEFPPESTWMVFTDVVPHSVVSGQFALEQTFLIARSSLETPSRAPVSILENLAGAPLIY